ncbi:hypothetical protein TSUD_34830 [Trifolium subterraneum]|uniref:Uncharacterized protein n=1 Tax=Trifolium subterraneum TaxID=3900 RepID=A0A2Z6MEE2_TRISU|nr:hypothetical protein TSUD_34830 [Trifolium subterraneum]
MPPLHLTTPSPHHLRLRSVTAVTTTLILDPTQPPITSLSQSPHPSQVPRSHPSPNRHNHHKRIKHKITKNRVKRKKHKITTIGGAKNWTTTTDSTKRKRYKHTNIETKQKQQIGAQ